MEKKKEAAEDDDLDDLLEQQWEKQDLINPKCKMREKTQKTKFK
ncbi:MAG: hypothetical protein ACTSRI_19155 [Promethearchaeota archaeon]